MDPKRRRPRGGARRPTKTSGLRAGSTTISMSACVHGRGKGERADIGHALVISHRLTQRHGHTRQMPALCLPQLSFARRSTITTGRLPAVFVTTQCTHALRTLIPLSGRVGPDLLCGIEADDVFPGHARAALQDVRADNLLHLHVHLAQPGRAQREGSAGVDGSGGRREPEAEKAQTKKP